MPNENTNQEFPSEFTTYLGVRLFGLVAFVDRPNQNEHFPMASGVVIETDRAYVLLTAAHYLKDVKRWKDEGRLIALHLLVHHPSGLCNPIRLNLDENIFQFLDILDVGFVALNVGVVAEFAKLGGVPIRRDDLSMSPGEMNSFYLVGLASAYCKVSREVVATDEKTEYALSRPTQFATVFSKLEFDGNGSDPGTFRFALIRGFDDYSGASGGPIIGYSQGALIPDYSLLAIQSKQIRSGTGQQKPTHLIASSAAVAVHLIDERIRELFREVAGEMDQVR